METNIFKMLNLETKENIHSSFIAAVFNSSDFARNEFIKILNEASGKEFEYCDLKAQTEKVLSSDKSARVDIYLTNYKNIEEKGDTRIIIENKIYAGDQNKQLKRYHDHLKNNKYRKTALFYLTLEGKDAPRFSRDNLKSEYMKSEYILLDYSEHIQKWLKQVTDNNSINSKLRIYIEDYKSIIEELTQYNSMIDNGFKENCGFDIKKYNTLLELRFWQKLEKNIIKKFSDIYQIDNQHRYYTYSRILKSNQRNGGKQHHYGIILEKKEIKDLPYFRLSVSPSTKKVSLKFGRFNGINWDNSVDNNNLKQINNVEDILDLSTLKNTNDFDRHINDILSKINELI